MGLITKEVEVNVNKHNYKHYESLGHIIPKMENKYTGIIIPRGTKILVKVEDLHEKSCAHVEAECDNCGKEINNITYHNFNDKINKYGGCYCFKCAVILYGSKNSAKTKLLNTKSFELWCIDNNKQDVLDRWDYELNKLKPNEIPFGTDKKYYFKCPKNIHNSELKKISRFTSGQEGSMYCKACNSFAQWGLDNIGIDFLDKYWDYEKNTVDPWEIAKGNKSTIIFIFCQKKDYHGSYKTKCSSFLKGNRCLYCINYSGNVHPLDSLGTLYPKVLNIWSDKNKKSPYEYAPMSTQEVYWKCPEGKHEDYPRSINVSNMCDFRCPECSYSKGEERISNCFIDKGFTKIDQDDFNQLIDENKYNKNYYIPQKEFKGLIGLGNGLLSYDFHIPKLNLLIEYHGMQHEKYIKGFHKSKKDFEKQLEHDNRKCIYAESQNINLLIIWYWDFDRIEVILEKELSKLI